MTAAACTVRHKALRNTQIPCDVTGRRCRIDGNGYISGLTRDEADWFEARPAFSRVHDAHALYIDELAVRLGRALAEVSEVERGLRQWCEAALEAGEVPEALADKLHRAASVAGEMGEGARLALDSVVRFVFEVGDRYAAIRRAAAAEFERLASPPRRAPEPESRSEAPVARLEPAEPRSEPVERPVSAPQPQPEPVVRPAPGPQPQSEPVDWPITTPEPAVRSVPASTPAVAPTPQPGPSPRHKNRRR